MQETTCNAGKMGSVLGLGRSLREGNYKQLQHYFLGNSIDRLSLEVLCP